MEEKINRDFYEMLYKGNPPFIKNENGFGVLGDVKIDKRNGKLECHLCGKFFINLSSHSANGHKIKCRDYKIKFGLPLSKGLCSKQESLKRSKRSIKSYKKNLKNKKILPIQEVLGVCKNAREVAIRKSIISNKYSDNSAYNRNQYASCDLQIIDRYNVLCKIIGHDNPVQSEYITYDRKLLSHIYKRFGSINNFREANNLSIIKQGGEEKVSRLDVIAELRKFFFKNNIIPRPKNFTSINCSRTTVYSKFGSWKNALVNSGLI